MGLSIPERLLEEKWEKEDHDRMVVCMREILKLDAGKEFVWHTIANAGVFDSGWDPGAKVHYNLGRQDYGRSILHLIEEADPEALVWMMRRAQSVHVVREAEREEALKSEVA